MVHTCSKDFYGSCFQIHGEFERDGGSLFDNATNQHFAGFSWDYRVSTFTAQPNRLNKPHTDIRRPCISIKKPMKDVELQVERPTLSVNQEFVQLSFVPVLVKYFFYKKKKNSRTYFKEFIAETGKFLTERILLDRTRRTETLPCNFS